MKFTCTNCSAKYQIADEKVAGRTVKMKCRKCGTMIPIRAPSRNSIAAAPLVHADSILPSPPGKSPRPPAVAPPPHTEIEWHAGINGQAIGPMTRKELERRAREGSVNKETFVWHEGMSGWKQIPEVMELSGLLERAHDFVAPPPPSMPAQAKAQALRPLPRPSLGPAVPAVAVTPLPRPSVPAQVPAKPEAIKPSRPTPAVGIPMVRPKGAAELLKTPEPQKVAEPQKVGVPQGAPGQQKDGPAKDWDAVLGEVGGSGISAAVTPSPAATPSPAPRIQDAPIPDIAHPAGGRLIDATGRINMPEHINPATGSIRPSYESLVMQLRKKRKNPLVIPFAIVAALVLGITVGFVLFGDQETKIVRQIVEVPAKVKVAMEEKQAAKELAAEVAVEGTPEEPSGQKGVAKAATAKNGTPAPATEVKGLQGLQGLDGLGGPSGGPTGPSGTASGGQELSSSQIQSTVAQNQNSVKRGCWERALMTRDKNAPSSARVSVSIKVAPAGNVTSATTSGDPPGYAGLASCITTRVRNWQFPRSTGSTTVNVPFVFAAQ